MTTRRRGFTTIELLIALVVAGVLVVVALPSFRDQLRKARRSDAVAALANLQQAQERWRSTNPLYAPNAQLTTGLAQRSTSASGYYTLAITASSATGYTATATAVSGTSQAEDAGCTTLAVRMDAGNLAYGSGTGPDWSDTRRCWAR